MTLRRRLWQGLLVSLSVLLLSAPRAPVPDTYPLPFSEDFEQGLSNRWSQETDTGNLVSQVPTPWTGRLALRAQTGTSTAAPHARIWTGISPSSARLSVRFYLYVPESTQQQMPAGSQLTVVQLDSGTAPKIRIQLLKNPDGSGQMFLVASWETIAGGTDTIGGPTGAPNTRLAVDQWHYVELVYPGGLSLQSVELFIDDPALPRATSPLISLVLDQQVSAMGVGIGESTAGAALDLLIDDLRVQEVGRSGYTGVPQFHANDYESPGVGVLQDPPGKDGQPLVLGNTSSAVQLQAGQGRDGSQALACVDASDASFSVQSSAVHGNLIAPDANLVFMRVWWRQATTPAMSGPYTLLALGDSRMSQLGPPLVALRFLPSGHFQLWGHNAQPPIYQSPPSTSPFNPSLWHLLEIEAYSNGPGNEARKAWVDGSLVALDNMPSWAPTLRADHWVRGVLAYDLTENGYLGTDYFDNARVASFLLPSHFKILPTSPDPLNVGQCNPVMVTASASANFPSPVPEAVTVDLVTTQGAFHDTCPGGIPSATPIASVSFAAGQTDAGVYFVPSATGGVSTFTGQVDYVSPYRSVLSVQAPTLDAGTDPADGGSPDAGSRGNSLVVYGLPKVTVPGAPHLVAVEALDGQGRTDTSYTGTVRFSAVPSVPRLPLPYTFTLEDRGLHAYSGAAFFDSPGSYDVSVGDTANVTAGTHRVDVLAPGELGIVADHNMRAMVGTPYVYNGAGAVTVVSTTGQPVTFSLCGTSNPIGFTVDSRTGAVRWTPNQPGFVQVCIAAASASKTATVNYQVLVEPPSSSGQVTAGFVLRPDPSFPGTPVLYDPVGTSVSTERRFMQWRFGDGSPLSTMDTPVYRYLLPGGYRPRLAVWDELGRFARTARPMKVLDGMMVPPTVEIVSKDGNRGPAPFSTELEATVSWGSAPEALIRWNLGDGRVAYGSKVQVTYGAGRYWPSVVAVDRNGLAGTDKIQLAVPQGTVEPPECIASADPPVVFVGTAASATTRLYAVAIAGASPVSDVDWQVDGATFPGTRQLSRTYTQPGWHHAVVTVKDGNQLKCIDDVTVTVITAPQSGGVKVPPTILGPAGLTGECAVALEAPPLAAVGSGPLQWSVEQAPDGLTIDQTGQIAWTPPIGVRDVTFDAVATSTWGEDRRPVTVSITCRGDLDLRTTACGCGAGGGALPGLMLLAAAALRRRLRRRQ